MYKTILFTQLLNLHRCPIRSSDAELILGRRNRTTISSFTHNVLLLHILPWTLTGTELVNVCHGIMYLHDCNLRHVTFFTCPELGGMRDAIWVSILLD